MPSSNFSQVHRAGEVSPGILASSPAFERAYYLTQNLKPQNTTVKDETITGDRIIKEHLQVAEGAGGQGTFNWIYGGVDWAVELLLNDRFTPMLEAYNATADSKITDVDQASDTMTAEGGWAEGMLCRTSGLTDANNKLFRAAAGSTTDTLVGPAGTFGADDTAPAAGARAICLGLQGAEGDLEFVADGITSTALDFTTLPITAYVAAKVSGSSIAANNTFVTIASVTANKITLTDLPANWAMDDGSGDTIRIWIGDYAEHAGQTLLSDTFEWTNTRMSPQGYVQTRGAVAQSGTFNYATGAIVNGSIDIVGFSNKPSSTSVAASKSEPLIGLGLAMRTGKSIARLTEGGSSLPAAVCEQDLTYNWRNNVTPVSCLKDDGPIDYSLGDAENVITGNYRFGDITLFQKVENKTPTSQFLVMQKGTTAYAKKSHYGVYTDGGIADRGKGNEVLVNAVFEGSKDPVSGKLVSMTRFREFE